MKVRKKPVVVDAVLYDGTSTSEIESLITDKDAASVFSFENGNLVIFTLEGNHRASVGDWIVKGVKGEFYPVKPDIFAATYDIMDESQEDRI